MSNFEIVELNESSDCDSKLRVKQTESSNERWQKIVLYYLARLKGLCDWRNKNNKTKTNARNYARKCSSQELETRILDNITQKPNVRASRRQQINLEKDEIGCCIMAGYDEGKQQAVKIISRSLKYGAMTGILLKRGNCYRIAPEYLYVCNPVQPPKKRAKNKGNNRMRRRKCSVKSVKANVRGKAKQKKGKNVTEAATKNCPKKKSKRIYYHDDSDEGPSNKKRNKRASDTKINLSESSQSNSTFQTLSRSLTPIDDRKKKRDVKAKRPRPKIQKPINYEPPRKKPRTKSQSKSPSHHTDDDEVMDAAATSRMIINKFRMPRPQRYSNVMSSMSSSTLGSCKRCDCDHHVDQMIKRRRRK